MLLKHSNKPFHKHWLLQGLTLGFYVLSHYCHHLEDTFRTATRISSSFISKFLELGVLSCSVPPHLSEKETEGREDPNWRAVAGCPQQGPPGPGGCGPRAADGLKGLGSAPRVREMVSFPLYIKPLSYFKLRGCCCC